VIKKIPQREARRLRKRVAELEALIQRERSVYAGEWPGGVHIGSFSTDAADSRFAAVHTARKLDHAVVVVSNDYKNFNVYALPHPKAP
jgi:hypothetical protein